MPSMSDLFKMATEMANSHTPEATKKRPPKHFVGPGSALVSLLAWWVSVGSAHPLSRVAHSAGNFFVHDPVQAAVAVISGLLFPRFSNILKKAVKK